MKGFYLGSGRRSEDQGLAILPSINYNGPMADESIGRRQVLLACPAGALAKAEARMHDNSGLVSIQNFRKTFFVQRDYLYRPCAST